MNGAAGDTWVINPHTVNQFVTQWLNDKHNTLFPQCPLVNTTSVTAALGPDACLSESIATASGDRQSGISNAYRNWFNRERKWQWRDDFSRQIGRHSLKAGVDYVYLPTDGGFFAAGSPGAIYLSADPSVIASNKTPVSGRIPVAQCHLSCTWRPASPPTAAANDVGGLYSNDNCTVGTYVQDDFKVSPTITLNLGLRWDVYSIFNSRFESFTQCNLSGSESYRQPLWCPAFQPSGHA